MNICLGFTLNKLWGFSLKLKNKLSKQLFIFEIKCVSRYDIILMIHILGFIIPKIVATPTLLKMAVSIHQSITKFIQ